MTDTLNDIDTPSDAELISRVRGGDVAAYGDLFSRHVQAATRLSRQLIRGSDADDLVSEAFAKVLTVLQGGGGPDVAFRAYLLTAVRRLHVDKMRASSKLQTSDDMSVFDPGVPFQDTAVAAFESGAAARAFASLPERWQMVLWHLEVEGQKPAEIAGLLGMSANSVSALAYRAREGLRQAFLQMHLNDTSETECKWVNEHLGAFIRKGLAKRDTLKVQAHLDQCRRCTAMYLELTEVNSNLAGLIAPLLLGAAATGYVAGTGAATGGLGLLGSAVGRARDVVMANTGVATAGAVAAGVVAATAAGAFLIPRGDTEPVAGPDAPLSAGQQAPGTSPSPGTGTTPDGKPEPSGKPSPTAGPSPAAEATEPPADEPFEPAALLAPAEPEAEVPGALDPTDPTDPGGPTDPTDPTDPGNPTDPGGPTDPTDPGGPTDPTNPGNPTDPGGPTDPGNPTDPTPPVVTTDVDLAGTTIDEDGLHLVAAGEPLPPTLTVDLTSDPAGVTFAPGGDCEVSNGGTTAVCTTGAVALGAPRMPARAAARTSYTADLPFAGLASQPDTLLTITVSVPDGFEDPDIDNNTLSYTSRTADVSLTTPRRVEAGRDGSYRFTGSVAGVPAAYAGHVTFAITGPAAFAGAATESCEVTGQESRRLVCDAPADGLVDFHVAAEDNRDVTDVEITVSPLARFRDRDLSDNTAASSLERYVPEADLTLTLPERVEASLAGRYHVTGTLSGVPGGYTGTVRLRVTGDVTPTEPVHGCSIEGKDLLCPAVNGTVSLTLATDDPYADTRVTITAQPLTGTTDPNPGDNGRTVTLAGAVREVDLSLSLPDSVRPAHGVTHVVPATLAGVPAGFTGKVRLTLSPGVEPVSAAGCTVAGQVFECDAVNGRLDLTVRVKDSSAETVLTITAALVGTTDPDPGDNTASVRLERPPPPVDVVMSQLYARNSYGPPTKVRAQIDGVPRNVDRVLFRLSRTGTTSEGVRFVNGAAGATGEGPVDCWVTSADLVTCVRASQDPDGSFWVDMDVDYTTNGHASPSATIAVEAEGSGEPDSAKGNNVRTVTFGVASYGSRS